MGFQIDVPSHIHYVFVARVLKRIYYKLFKHCMLTTIKEYAYYKDKIHKNKLKKLKRSISPRSAFALSTFGSWYSNAVHGTVRLTASKIKACKSLRFFNHLPVVHPNVYQPKVHLQTSRCFLR